MSEGELQPPLLTNKTTFSPHSQPPLSSHDEQPISVAHYDETQYPRAAEESETESGGLTEEEIISTTVNGTPQLDDTLIRDTSQVTTMTAMKVNKEEEQEEEEEEEEEKQEESSNEIMSCGVCFQLLLDPVTLNCGHSFCQICLARLWQTSNNAILLCPMCRQPWAESGRSLPSVNVLFREVLEHSYPEKIKERREGLTETEKDILRQYSQGTRPILSRLATGGQRQFNINLVGCLLGVMICMVFLIVISISMSLLLMGGAGDHFIRKPVSHWNNEDVLEWLKGLGDTVQKDANGIFDKEKIDGRHLVTLTADSLIEYGLSSELSRNSLLLSIEQLKESQYAPPRNFYEFMTANKEDAVLLLLTYKIFPRLTFAFVYMFHYYDIFLPVVQAQLHHNEIFSSESNSESHLLKDNVEIDQVNNEKEIGDDDSKVVGEENEKGEESKTEKIQSDVTSTQLAAIIMEILLVPHLIVAMYSITGLQVVPVIAFVILIHCIVATLREVKDLRNKLRTRQAQGQVSLRSLVKTSLASFTFYVLLLGVGKVFCLILPPFILDVVFYLLLFNIIYSMLYAKIIKPVFQRIAMFGAQILVQFMNGR